MVNEQRPAGWDSIFPDIQQEWLDHDPSCATREHMWFGRGGGVTDPTELDECHGCGVTFWGEYVTAVDVPCIDEPGEMDRVYFCDCCLRRTDGVYVGCQCVSGEEIEARGLHPSGG